ncbi:hypothetical protein ACFU5D_17005 [Streptomyces anthocyanicus]|uniref:hypothetical protein n=1 Tax=Streptomyces anthocyanicus TaxID=68174 RepID=UPI0036832B7B
MNAEQWNARYPVGTLVFAYPGVRPEDGADTRLVTRTRTAAQLSASGDPVVWVEGEGSCISLTHVDPVAEDAWEEARKAEKQAELKAEPVTARLSPEREAEIAAAVAVYGGHPNIGFACCSAHGPADGARELLAELAAVRAERDQARSAAFEEAAAFFDGLADAEKDQHGYRARVMRGAANDVRRLNSREAS